MFVDKGQYTRKSELCWSLLSTLLVLLWMSRYRCAAPKISLVNEVLVGLEWRDLIGQQKSQWAKRAVINVMNYIFFQVKMLVATQCFE